MVMSTDESYSVSYQTVASDLAIGFNVDIFANINVLTNDYSLRRPNPQACAQMEATAVPRTRGLPH